MSIIPKVWVVLMGGEPRSVFTNEGKAYEEACEHILSGHMAPQDDKGAGLFLTLYDAHDFKPAFEEACKKGLNRWEIRVRPLFQGVDESEFVQD